MNLVHGKTQTPNFISTLFSSLLAKVAPRQIKRKTSTFAVVVFRSNAFSGHFREWESRLCDVLFFIQSSYNLLNNALKIHAAQAWEVHTRCAYVLGKIKRIAKIECILKYSKQGEVVARAQHKQMYSGVCEVVKVWDETLIWCWSIIYGNYSLPGKTDWCSIRNIRTCVFSLKKQHFARADEANA